jgi:hypothetical protein
MGGFIAQILTVNYTVCVDQLVLLASAVVPNTSNVKLPDNCRIVAPSKFGDVSRVGETANRFRLAVCDYRHSRVSKATQDETADERHHVGQCAPAWAERVRYVKDKRIEIVQVTSEHARRTRRKSSGKQPVRSKREFALAALRQ